MKAGWRLSLAVFAVLATASGLRWLDGLEHRLTDLAFAARGPLPPAPGVVVAPIGEECMADPELGPWPWSPAIWTRIVEGLFAAGARVVALDVPGLGEAVDLYGASAGDRERFLAVLARRPVVLPFALVEGESSASIATELLQPFACGVSSLPSPPGTDAVLALPPTPLAARAHGLGATNLYPDADGVVRCAPLLVSHGGTLYPSLALEMLRLRSGLPRGEAQLRDREVALGSRRYRTLKTGEVVINFAGGYTSYSQVSVLSILGGKPAGVRSQLRGAVVVLGPNLAGRSPRLRTPVAPQMPGIEVQANILGNLLRGDYARPLPPYTPTLLLLGVCLLTGFLAAGRGALAGTLATLALAILVWLAGHLLFGRGLVAPTGALLAAVVLTGGASVAVETAVADRRKAAAEARLQSRMQAIAGVGQLADRGLDRAELLDGIMRWVQTELEVEACSMLTLDTHQHLRFEVALGPKGDLAKDFTLELGEGIAGLVAQTGEPLVVNSAAHDPRRHQDIPRAIDYPLEKVVCVPMTLRGEVIGVIEAMNRRDGSDFTAQDTSLLTVIAQEAALFLENARLYGVLQRRVELANAEVLDAMGRLRAEKARIEALVEEMADGVLATDRADRIVLVNSQARHLLGLEGRRLENEPVLAVVRDPVLSDLFARPLSLEGGSASAEVDLRGDGQQVFRITVVQISGPGGELDGKCAVLSDVTRFRQLDTMKNDQLSFVSHELNAVLTSLVLYAAMLRARLQSGDHQEAAQTADAVDRQVKRMRHMVEGFLNVSRLEAGIALEMNWARIGEVEEAVREIVGLEGRLATGHEFGFDLPDGLPDLWADRGKLEEVLINLVNNAIKYSPDGGQVSVRAQPEGGMVRFSVSDEGIGMGPEEQARLFQRFQRVAVEGVSRRVSGTGLGLFLCKALVEAHGGRIWVDSQVGAGTTCHFTVPAYADQEAEGGDHG